ncbi:hypothetical protein CVIRNUC_006123 [Coccomyxa viridis]|uniref:Carbonic anhydrase n=1 Tax=Coccomyxa viridis TaxID=1274662 RepID=A0AAV1I6F0_9CHLO|nr:hypothetical protein CVIRNUC_006123 [Coccomyxa viridis]
MAYLYLPIVVLGTLALIVVPSDGAGSAQTYRKGLSGVQLCAEPNHVRGGPAAPLYNYASDGDDWLGICQTGSAQSPIDLSRSNVSSLRLIQNPKQQISFGSIVAAGNAVLRLEVDEVELISGDWNKTGFSIPVCGSNDIACLESDNTSAVQYITPNISNLHFHGNSEHTLEGLIYGAEAHLVTNLTVNGRYHLVVFGVWMNMAGNKTNDFYAQLEPYVTSGEGADCAPVPDNTTFAIEDLLPTDKSYFAYRGSLTTPPCSEGVTWIVFTNPVKISIAQVKSLYQSSAHISQPCAKNSKSAICNVVGARTNNRPVQPANGRVISLANVPGNIANN